LIFVCTNAVTNFNCPNTQLPVTHRFKYTYSDSHNQWAVT